MRLTSTLLIYAIAFGIDYQSFMNLGFDIPVDQQSRNKRYPEVTLRNNQIYNLRTEVRNAGISRKRM
jgi:hypothetical protein